MYVWLLLDTGESLWIVWCARMYCAVRAGYVTKIWARLISAHQTCGAAKSLASEPSVQARVAPFCAMVNKTVTEMQVSALPGTNPQRTPSELARHKTVVADALSGDPRRAAMASALSGMIQACLLLPLNTLQTQMQTRGLGALATLRANFVDGFIAGLRNLYRAIGPTIGMLGMRQGLKFGSASAFKQYLPDTWPELARDVTAGATSAVAATTLVFPLDTLKTRMQNGLTMPSSLYGFYSGFRPAASYSAIGMGLWVATRNGLERKIPYDGPGKHLITGAAAGIAVQLPTFPLDTLKKRLQCSTDASAIASLSSPSAV